MDNRSRVAILTGASSGIGYAVAEQMARRGYSIVLGSRKPEEAACQLREKFGVDVCEVPGDLACPDTSVRLIEMARGLGTVRALFLNHGGPGVKAFEEIDDSHWSQAFQLIVLGPLRLLRACLPLFRSGGEGRVVAISSFSCKMPQAGIALSNSLRSALVNALNTAALELGPENMYFNSVAPGYIDTGRLDEWNRSQANRAGMDYRDVEARALEKIPLSRFGKPHDVASVVGYLLSEDNTYVTGQHILADGGLVTQL